MVCPWFLVLTTEVAQKLASQLSLWASQQAIEDDLVIYGFSAGADLLMEMMLAETQQLFLPQKTLLILADPNISKKTCFITEKAIELRCDTIDAFISIIQELTDNAKTTEEEEHWRRYLEAIKNNRGNLPWTALKRIATTIVEGADDRFREFLLRLDAQGMRRSGKQIVKIELSTDGYQEFEKCYAAKRHYKWINSDSNMQHFNLSDPGQIKVLVQAAIEKQRGYAR